MTFRAAIDPRMGRIVAALAQKGYRTTSIYRAGAPSHQTGKSLDVAEIAYKTPYDETDAERVKTIIDAVSPNSRVAAIAEDDHIHVDLDSNEPGIGTFDGVRLTMKENGMRNHFYETGDPAVDSAVTLDVAKAQIMSNKGDPRERAKIAMVANDPSMVKKAAQIDTLRELLEVPTVWTFARNADVVVDSLGDLGPIRPADGLSLKNDISRGIPPFTPRVFPALVIANDAYIFPAYALGPSWTPPGPFGVGVRFDWAGSLLTITAPLNFSRAGVPFTVDIVFGPGADQSQSITAEVIEGTVAVNMSIIHGQISGGRPRRSVPNVSVVAGIPNPLTDFPYLRVSGLPFTGLNPFTLSYRFFVPGDRTVEAFLRYMG
jgi:hypothetical protein